MKSLFDIETVPVVSERAIEYGITVKSRSPLFKVSSHIVSSSIAAKYFAPLFGDEIMFKESFFIAFVDRANKIIGWSRISSGGRASTVVDVAIIAKLALDTLCSGVFLCHNHPSGTLRPSPQDDTLTKSIAEALKLFDIRVLDHIILTPSDDYYSYNDEGRL
ncbi:MAG: JAB domain-containing protein [Bacteroides sp.]|nr:JAB domain-containing protein [Bacteroides sp.]MCM1391033.1 JAB domain-containing protein [Bacteroides sp.]